MCRSSQTFTVISWTSTTTTSFQGYHNQRCQFKSFLWREDLEPGSPAFCPSPLTLQLLGLKSWSPISFSFPSPFPNLCAYMVMSLPGYGIAYCAWWGNRDVKMPKMVLTPFENCYLDAENDMEFDPKLSTPSNNLQCRRYLKYTVLSNYL